VTKVKVSELLLAAMTELRPDDLSLGICVAIEWAAKLDRFPCQWPTVESAHEYTDLFEPGESRTPYWGVKWADGLVDACTKGWPMRKMREVADSSDLEQVYECRLLALGFAAAMAESDERN
jgi:hypothetical protein